MTKTTKICSFILLLILSFRSFTSAQEASPSGSDPKTDQIKEELEKKTAGETAIPQGEKKAFFGQIADLFNQTVILQTSQGKKTAKADEDVSIVDEKRQTIKFDDLEIGHYAIAMGYSETPEKIITKRIVLIPQPTKTEKKAFLGRVKKIDGQKIVLENLKDSQELSLVISAETTVQRKGEKEDLDIDAIKEETLVVAAGTFAKEKLTATTVYLLTEEETTPPAAEE